MFQFLFDWGAQRFSRGISQSRVAIGILERWSVWSFLGYVLKGRFVAIPDASLVATFKLYRVLEAVRLALFSGLVLWGLVQHFFFPAGR
jgi:hypothetical protein